MSLQDEMRQRAERQQQADAAERARMSARERELYDAAQAAERAKRNS